MSPLLCRGGDRRETTRFASHFRVGCWRRRATGVLEKWSSPQRPFRGSRGTEPGLQVRSSPFLHLFLDGPGGGRGRQVPPALAVDEFHQL